MSHVYWGTKRIIPKLEKITSSTNFDNATSCAVNKKIKSFLLIMDKLTKLKNLIENP